MCARVRGVEGEIEKETEVRNQKSNRLYKFVSQGQLSHTMLWCPKKTETKGKWQGGKRRNKPIQATDKSL